MILFTNIVLIRMTANSCMLFSQDITNDCFNNGFKLQVLPIILVEKLFCFTIITITFLSLSQVILCPGLAPLSGETK